MRRIGFGCALAAVAAAIAVGCGSTATAGSVPESAALAPADAIAFATVVSDDGSAQWQNADALLGLFPALRDNVLDEVESAFADEGLAWEEDVKPAVGPEIVLVVTHAKDVIVLVRPESTEKLMALVARDGDPAAIDTVSGWTALADEQAELDAFKTALEAGTLESNDSFTEAMEALPDESLGRAWVDLSSLSNEIRSALADEGLADELDFRLDAAAAAVSAEADGLLVVASVHGPKGTGTTEYEQTLFDRIPADAVAALSFGGTQELLDRLRRTSGFDDLAAAAEDAAGVSLDSLFDALSGEGALYVRQAPSGPLPEVTLALAPPDAQAAYDTVDRLFHRAAQEAGVEIATTDDLGVEVRRLTIEDVTLEYALLDGDTVIVTTSDRGIAAFLGDGAKLGESAEFRAAADRVELGDRTNGFLYVDVDGLAPLVEDLSGEQLPADARDAVQKIDSFILRMSGDGRTTSIGGFVRVNQT